MSGPAPPPVHRGYAIASLVLGILSIPTFGLLLVGAMTSVILGVVALVKESRQPEEYGGKGMAITGIVLAARLHPRDACRSLGIVAAIAIPSFLRARVSSNEAAALGDVREVIMAEARYQKANAGYFDRLECLAAPRDVHPRASGPVRDRGRVSSRPRRTRAIAGCSTPDRARNRLPRRLLPRA